MLIFLVLTVPTLLFLPALIAFALYPGPVRALWSRVRRDRVRPGPAQGLRGDLARSPLDEPAAPAHVGGPPGAGELCDRCAMRAAAAVYLAGGRLLLCGHHGRQHQSVLRTRGAVIVGDLALPRRAATAA